MNYRILNGRYLLAASAIAGLLLTACNSNDSGVTGSEPTKNTENPQRPGGTGILPEPSIPTEAEVKAMEALYGKPKADITLPDDIKAPAMLSKSSAADVNVGFNDYAALAQNTDKAYASFAGFYYQWVTNNAYSVVAPMEYGHYHLGYESATDCFAGSNGFVAAGRYGKLVSGKCIDAGDAATRPRNLSPHSAAQTIQFYVWDRVKVRTFDFKSFYLPPTSNLSYGHVQIWIYKVGIGWRYWADLPPATTGYTWWLPQTGVGGAQQINEVRITSPNKSGSYGWTIDNLMINNILP